jgi:hypothetical protein
MTAKTHTAHDHTPAHGQAPSDATTPAEPLYERVDLDRYVILNGGPVGYVEHVHPVFVCYVGHPYHQAAEIAQIHDFHDAVQAVLNRSSTKRSAR